MSNANAPTRSVVVQTTLRVIENSDEGNLVVSDRGCQTAIAARPSLNEVNLLPLLEFIPYSEIDKGGIKVIQLPRKALLQFNLSGEPPTKTFSESTYKSVLKKSLSNSSFSTLHLTYHLSSIPMAKIYEDQICQTDLSVSPYILEEDSVANVRREIGAQTSVTFEPSATINEIEPGLKEYISHSHCFVSIYQQGKFTTLENYQTQIDRYEIQEVAITLEEEEEEEEVTDEDASKSVPQQTEISVSKPQKTRKRGSLDYRYMTDEEFEENIGEILDRTVKNVTALMNKVVKVYEQSRPNLQKTSKEKKTKKVESSEDSLYFPVQSGETEEVDLEETEKVESEDSKEESEKVEPEDSKEEFKKIESEDSKEETEKVEPADSKEETEKVEPTVSKEETEKVQPTDSKKETEVAELEETDELKPDEIKEAERMGIEEIEPVETERDEEIELPREEPVTEPRVDSIEENAENEEVPTPLLESEVDSVKDQVEGKEMEAVFHIRDYVNEEDDYIKYEIIRIIERVIEFGVIIQQAALIPVGDTPEIKKKTHIECECEHPSEAGAAPPTVPSPTLREEPKRETPEKAKDEDRIVVEAVEGKAVMLELVVTQEGGIARRDSISCPETCLVQVPCSDLKEQIIRLSVVLAKDTATQQHVVPCKTVDNKLVQATQSDTQISVGQKPSTLSCGCTLQSSDTQAVVPVIPEVTQICSKTEEIVCGDRICETCEVKEEVSFREPAEEICNCLSMQSYQQCGIVSTNEKTTKSDGKLCECSSTLSDAKRGFCCCFELPFSDDEDDFLADHTCGKVCPAHVPFLQEAKREDARRICGEPIEIIYPEQSVCSCNFVSSTCVCGGKTDFDEIVSGTCVCSEEFSLPEICSYCRNLQEASGVCICGDGSDIRAHDLQKEEEKSAICTCGKLSQEITSTCTSDQSLTGIVSIKHPEGQNLSKGSFGEKEITLRRYCDSECMKNVAAQTMLTKDSARLIYQQSRNIVEPYMDKLRNYKVEAPPVQESSLLYLRDRRSIEQYLKALDPEDARDLVKTRIPIPKKSSIKNVVSKQMTLAAVEILSTAAKSDVAEKNQLVATNVTVRAAAWKVGEKFQSAFDSSFIKDTLTYVTNEEEVKVVERDSKSTPVQSTCSTAIGLDFGNLVKAASSETKKGEEEVIKEQELVRFLFESKVEEVKAVTHTQSRPTVESKRTPDPTQQNTPSKPEFLSNLDTDKMPCQCPQGAKTLASSEPTPNLTYLFEDDSEYHEGYMEEMTDENVSVQTQLNLQGEKIPLVECAGSLPDVTIETNRCDSKMEMPWLRISLPPVGYYQIDRMEGRPKKKTCDCWKLDTRDSVFLAEPVVQKVICPARTPDEYKALNLEGEDENVTGDSEDAEDDTPGEAIVTDAEETLEEDQSPVDKEVGEDQPVEEEEGAEENEFKKEESAGEDQSTKLQVDKKICVCLSAVEEDECAEFKKPMQLVYDNLCYEANEAYMDAIYKCYPDDCDTECGSRTEIPWEDIILPARVKLRATRKRPLQRPEVVPLYENAAVKGITETPSRARSDKSAKSDKSIHSQRSKKSAKSDKSIHSQRSKRSAKERKQGSTFEIEVNFAEAVSNVINIDGGAATQATVSQISAISDVRMIPRRCPKDYIITVKTTAGMEQRFGGGIMQTVGSQPFDYKTSQIITSEINMGGKIPEKTKSCEVTEVNESSVVEADDRKSKSMPDVPSKTSNVSATFAKFSSVKSGDQASVVGGGFSVEVTQKDSVGEGGKDSSVASGSFKPVRVRISKESTGKSGSLKSKDPTLIMATSEGSKGSQMSARAKESPCVSRSSRSREPVFFHVKKPIRGTSSKESRSSGRPSEAKYPGTEIKRPVVNYNTSGNRDPIMEALQTYQQEMKPLRESLDKLKAKIRSLNLPELSSWSCNPQNCRTTPTPSTSMYGRRYTPNMMGAPYGMLPPPPNMFGMGPPLPPSYYLPSQFNFVPPPNMYHPSPFGSIPPHQFQTYPSSRSVVCKCRRSKSRRRRRHRRRTSSRSSSEMSEYSASGDETTKCPFLGTTSGVSCASLPKSCASKVKRRPSKGRVCACRQKRHAKTETRGQRIAQGTRAEPEVKIHFAPRDGRSGRGRSCKAVQHVAGKALPYVKNNKVRVALQIAPSSGGSTEMGNPSGEDSCPCKN